jgi:uncharacterized protein YjbJ (UPF0337 family)
MTLVPSIVQVRRYPVKDKIQGKAEELKGRLTGDKSEKAKGEARQKYGDAKDTVRDVREDVFEDPGEHGPGHVDPNRP